MSLNLRALSYLVAVASHPSFGQAAKACGVSQPTLSTQLKKLETELGVTLVERSPRGVTVTPVGQLIVERAERMLDDEREIQRIASGFSSPGTAVVRLGMFPTVASYLLPYAIPRLRDALPEMNLQLVERLSERLIEQLHSGELDAAVLALPVHQNGLRVEPIFREDFLLAAPKGHRLANSGHDVAITDLRGEPLLLLSHGHCLRDQVLQALGESDVDVTAGPEATSLETLRHMVFAGAGAAMLPAMAAESEATGDGVVLRAFSQPRPHREIALVWRESSSQHDLFAQIADILRTASEDHTTPLSSAS